MGRQYRGPRLPGMGYMRTTEYQKALYEELPPTEFLYSLKNFTKTRKRLKSTPITLVLRGRTSLSERRDEGVGSEGLRHAWNRQWKICFRLSNFNISG